MSTTDPTVASRDRQLDGSDWPRVTLGELFEFQNGVNADKAAYGSGVPFANVLEVITRNFLDASQIPGLVSLPDSTIAAFALRDGDVLFNRTSETQEEVGFASVYRGSAPAVFGGFVIRGRPRNSKLKSAFAAYALRSPRVRAQLIARGQGAVRANVGQRDLAQVEVQLPGEREQLAISVALSDADALIESLEQLLAKKRQLKQGAMQELLTGKKRLPGFAGPWTERRLGELARVKTGSLNNQDKSDDGEYPFFVRSASVERIDTFTHEGEAILIPGEGGIGSIFHYVNGRFAVHQRVYAINEFAADVSGRFVYEYLRMHFGRHAMENSVKATVDSLRLPTFTSFSLLVPPTLDEQAAVVEVLSTLDTELEALEARLAKARALKQGMAQALLTGRIRLAPFGEQASAAPPG